MASTNSTVRYGSGYSLVSVTAVAAVTALPTTAAQFSFKNGEAAVGGKSYFVDAVGTIITTASGATGSMGIVATMSQAVVADLATPMSMATVMCMNGKTYAGLAQAKVNVTLGADTGWAPFGNGAIVGSTTAVGSILELPVNGLIVIPPQFQLSLALIGVNTTLAGKMYIRWYEGFPGNQ